MAAEEVYQRILEHLKKDGSLNTFRLARDLELDRSRLLNFIEKLEKAGAVEVQHGMVKFLKFSSEEKRIALKPKISSGIKESEQKVEAPKLIRRIMNKNVPVIKKVYVKSKKLEEQAKQIARLEETIKELKKKVSARPKTRTITKTITKKVPVTRTVIKKIPVSSLLPKFKFPKFTFMKNIKQLKKPEFTTK